MTKKVTNPVLGLASHATDCKHLVWVCLYVLHMVRVWVQQDSGVVHQATQAVGLLLLDFIKN